MSARWLRLGVWTFDTEYSVTVTRFCHQAEPNKAVSHLISFRPRHVGKKALEDRDELTTGVAGRAEMRNIL